MDFTEEQKLYLEGFGRALAAARGAQAAPSEPAGPERIHFAAQNRVLAAGGKLVKEEEAKRAKHPFDMWDEIAANAAKGEFPKGADVFLYKFHGLFHVAPAQNSFMLRLRNPNGILDSHKLRAVAAIAEDCGGSYAHVTTRANLQIREIAPKHALRVLERLAEAGLTSRGAGADNVRNITGNPTAGIDPVELADTRPLGLELYHTILNHRELFGLPRKFNIAFDGGGRVASLEDTNDIGLSAVRVGPGKAVPEGVYFRVAVGGITGHGDFARDLGVLVAPEHCVPVAVAIVRVFIDEGDRTDRKRARLKYVLDRMGPERFLAETEKRLAAPLSRLSLAECEPRPPRARGMHVGFHAQKQAGRVYCGVALPVGKMTAAQMRGIADIAERRGSGTIRLTPWQNLIVSDIAQTDHAAVAEALGEIGLSADASSIRAGIVACTGNTGCKFSASDTKRHALAIAEHLDARLAVDAPLNIHLTGCPNSCAQHTVGDIGLLATKIAAADAEIEGYHLFAGGGFGDRRGLGREILRDIPADEVPQVLERLLRAYLGRRDSPEEDFQAFARRHGADALRAFAQAKLREAA
ncbi:MAG: NirA family protein [Betaproteobacteria bacterium]|nr:MAG: NirA family protein [Betaproteobacteria bacterium]